MSDHQTISFGSNYSRSMTTIANVVHHSQSLNSLSVLICKRQFQCQRQYYSHYLCLDCFQEMSQRCRRIAPRNVFQKETQTQNGQWPELCPLGLKKTKQWVQPTNKVHLGWYDSLQGTATAREAGRNRWSLGSARKGRNNDQLCYNLGSNW